MCLTEANETANLTFYIDDIAFTNEGAEMPENSDSDKPVTSPDKKEEAIGE